MSQNNIAAKINTLCLGLLLTLSPCWAERKPVDKPEVIEPGYRPDISSDEGGLWYQVDKFEQRLKQAPVLIRDPELNLYLKNITCKLARDHCPYIRVYLIDNPHFNASMAPNGMMHIWSGLLLRVENEDELAAVIGHELGHYLKSHSIKQWRKLRDGLSVAIFFDLLLTGGLATLVTASNAMSFSRKQESEADLYGIQLLESAGYSPHASYKLWEYLETEEGNDSSKEKRSIFFSTHPKIKNRIKALKSYVATPENLAKQRERELKYVAKIKPLYFDLMSKHLLLRDFGRTELLLKKHEKLGYPLAQVLFFNAEMHRLRDQGNDRDRAVDFYRASINEAGTPVTSYRELGYLLIKSGLPEAKSHLKTYLEKSPDATDNAMVNFYLKSH